MFIGVDDGGTSGPSMPVTSNSPLDVLKSESESSLELSTTLFDSTCCTKSAAGMGKVSFPNFAFLLVWSTEGPGSLQYLQEAFVVDRADRFI